MIFQFPKIRVVNEMDIRRQVECVADEAEELRLARDFDQGVSRITEEALDTLHAAETLLRMIEGQQGPAFVQDAMHAVIKKNRDRGYYDC